MPVSTGLSDFVTRSVGVCEDERWNGKGAGESNGVRGCYVLGIYGDAARDGFVKGPLSRGGSEFPECLW